MAYSDRPQKETTMSTLSLGLQLGYWGALAPGNAHVELAQEAERLGFDSVWTAESWGSDCFTPLAWIGAHTKTIRLGTSVAQLSARTPAACAMATLSLDGEFYPLPYNGPGAWGMGKPLKSITHPLRADVPIFIGAEGPKNVTQTAEIADGWLPLYYSPYRQDVYADQLTAAKPGFEIAPTVLVNINDDMEQALYPVKAMLGFYIGGMGAAKRNFHKELMARMGYPEEADQIQKLFFEGKRDEAIAAVPSEFADEISLSGPKDRIKEKLKDWENSPVTSLLINGDINLLRTMAEIAI